MSEIISLNRRDFLKTTSLIGGGLLLGFHLTLKTFSGEATTPEFSFAPNAFIQVGRDGTVTFILGKSEMGQGVYTSLPMLIAEELECDWRSVRVEPAPVDQAYNHTVFGLMVTGGSTSVRSEWDRLSKAGAIAREMLIAAAARTWNVDPASCRAENSMVIHTASGKKLSYGKLADKAAKIPVPKDVRLKNPDIYKIVGKPRKRLDSLSKVTGAARFGLDVMFPGMLTAVIVRPPVFGGKVASFNATKAKRVPGVKGVFQVSTGIAVLADDFHAAQQGREALEITWDEGEWARLSTPKMLRQYAEMARTPGLVSRNEGNTERAYSEAARKISAEYDVPYLAHATMEPMNCCVNLKKDRCDIWTGTQMQTIDRDTAARIAGLEPEKVKVHTTFLGGGFGRRANPASDFVGQSVEVAKAVKRPVKVIWSREDDMKGGYYRPMWHDRLIAGIDAGGNLIAWNHTIVGQSIIAGTPFERTMVKNGIDGASVEGAQDIPYAIPNLLVDLHSPKIGVPVLWWRSVGHSHTAFVVESFLDEAAHAAGKDPFEFRHALLVDKPRHRVVLELAARKAGWGTLLPQTQARGIAVHESFGSFIAQVAEVSVSTAGKVRVHRVVCAVDCGRVVNPSTIEAQMESGIVFGLSAALYGAITLRDGRVEQSNFDDYKVLRIDEMPKVEVHIVQSKEKPGGVGEPGVPPIAPAVCNAIFSLTGKRIRSLPIRTEDLKGA